MSRKYMNERWCVRCGREGATPFLKKHLGKLFKEDSYSVRAGIIDIGCGNGRNLQFLHSQGFTNTVGFDMVNDFGYKIALGKDKFPLLNHSVSVILANYVFMFLKPSERRQLIRELRRIATYGTRIMVELYPAKDSETPSDGSCTELQNELLEKLTEGGKTPVLVNNKHRFIAEVSPLI